MQQHETVGRVFKGGWGGGLYRCTRWIRVSGFDMEVIEPGSDPARKTGDIINVSERAIGRTYHRQYNDETYTPHVQPCNCYVCEGRPRA